MKMMMMKVPRMISVSFLANHRALHTFYLMCLRLHRVGVSTTVFILWNRTFLTDYQPLNDNLVHGQHSHLSQYSIIPPNLAHQNFHPGSLVHNEDSEYVKDTLLEHLRICLSAFVFRHPYGDFLDTEGLRSFAPFNWRQWGRDIGRNALWWYLDSHIKWYFTHQLENHRIAMPWAQ